MAQPAAQPIPDISPQAVAEIQAAQRAFFNAGRTRDLSFRREKLRALAAAVEARQEEVAAALAEDLGKPRFEAYATEIGLVVAELKEAASRLGRWARPRGVLPSLLTLPATAAIRPEPLGVVLIIGPWNYPFQLQMAPLVGAVAAGCCAVLKPSELTPRTATLVAELIAQVFDPGHVTCALGGIATGQRLLEVRWDHVFFTGSTRVGRLVMQAAARHLTPVTLELGGKSPTIVDADADVATAARRVAWGKTVNAGQTCIAPDYALVHESVKPAFVVALRQAVTASLGEDPKQSPHYARIVSEGHARRLVGLMEGAEILFGGESAPEERYVAPTALEGVGWDHPIMQEEIFGPILPVLTFRDLGEVIQKVNEGPKPLALYYFGSSRARQDRILAETSSGGACINDVALHFSVSGLPFGGVGDSGMGAYHSRASFDTFSHHKGVLHRGTWFDPPIRYAPWGEGAVKVIKRVFRVG